MESVYTKVAKIAISNELQQGLQPFVYWHVVESIQEGYSPDAIGELQEEVEVEALVLEHRSIARDRALGHFISLLHQYLARQTHSHSIDAAIKALEIDLDNYQSPPALGEFRLDTAEIDDYVEKEKENAGIIADDPAWHPQKNVASKMQWNVEFKRSLDLTRQAYIDACQRFQHRFDLGSQDDFALLQLVSNQELVPLMSQTAAKPRHIPAPPSKPAGDSPPTSSFWSQRITSSHTNATALPQFDEPHLVLAGQRFRTAAIEHARSVHATATVAPELGKDVTSILSRALNPDTNPERLVQSAQDVYASVVSSTEHEHLQAEETTIRRAKDLLSSALRLLGLRDGERNITVRIDAHNLRGHINHRLSMLKPRNELNYLRRAVADWDASMQLDADQPAVAKQLSSARVRLQTLDTHSPEPASTDSNPLKHSSSSGPATTASPAASSTSAPKATTIKASQKPAATTVASASARSGDSVEPGSSKPREKTILESPFFRADLVTGLMVDALLALPFPHKALRETLRLPAAAALASASQDHVHMLERLATSHQQTTQSLSAENKAQLKTAIKAVSAVLALPDLQQHKRDDPPEKVLRRTSLRLVLGTLFLLLNDFVRAQTELNLVSNALKPNTKAKGGSQANQGQSEQEAPVNSQSKITTANADELKDSISSAGRADRQIDTTAQMQTRVQGEALFLLSRICWMTKKVQEAVKFFRWLVKWYSDQQAALAAAGAGLDVPEIDLAWWDRLLVVTKQ